MKLSNFTEFKFGWRVVLASAIGIGLGLSPLPFYTIGVFAAPLGQEFGWGIDQVMAVFPLFTITVFIVAPIVGSMADQVGVRKIVLGSILLFSLSFIAFSLSNGSHALFMAMWVIMAIVGAGTLPITFSRAVNNWFNENRGLALGLSLLGTGLFGAFAKLFAAYFIEQFGWRTAYLAVGLLPLLVSLPIAYFFFRDTRDPKVADRVKQLKEAVPSYSGNAPGGMSLKQALKDYRFYILAIGFVLISFAVGGPIPNLETIFGSKGFDTGQSVLLASMIGYSVFVGRILGGYLIDRFWAPGVAFVFLCMPAISFYLLSSGAVDYGTAALAVIILGFAAGVEYDLLAFLVSRYFGMKHYATIYGAIYGFFGLGAGFGPYFFGRSFATTGSYDQILGYSMIAIIVGAVPLLFLGKYRQFE